MDPALHSLNPPQREAVMTTEGPVLVLAGAGTGKTRVITHRMAYLIEKGVDPHQILALTFTNKAAREMKERFFGLVKEKRRRQELNQLFAGTFHSFCVRILRQHIHHLGYKNQFTIFAESDQNALLKDLLGRGAAAAEINRIKSLISLAKNKGVHAGQVTSDAAAARAFVRYQEELKIRNALDFDDLLLLGLQLVRENEIVRETLRYRHRYLMVDEYQDTNQLQFELVRLLAGETRNLCVVGDDDQSIYSWRGADSGHILEFHEHFPGAKVIKLEQNYRSTPNILRAANEVIRHNARRHGKVLWSSQAEGPPIRLLAAQDDAEEAQWVANDISRLRLEEMAKWEDFAILYRANHLSRLFEDELRRARIPYRIIGGVAFYERREVKDVAAYLRLMLDPKNDNALLRIINTPARGIGKTTLENLLKASQEKGLSVWEEIEAQIASGTDRGGGLRSFSGLVRQFQPAFLAESGWAPALKALLEAIDYFGDIKRNAKDGEEAMGRTGNVTELITALSAFEEKKEGSLNEFLDSLVLDTEKDKDKNKDKKEDGYGVTLMTLHSAKGLEFPRVYLVGLEEGLLPHDRVKLEGNLDEERRLFYVGITRAMRQLQISYCVTRRRYGQSEPRHPSTFLDNLPDDAVERLEGSQLNKQADEGTALGSLSALRERLSAKA